MRIGASSPRRATTNREGRPCPASGWKALSPSWGRPAGRRRSQGNWRGAATAPGIDPAAFLVPERHGEIRQQTEGAVGVILHLRVSQRKRGRLGGGQNGGKDDDEHQKEN